VVKINRSLDQPHRHIHTISSATAKRVQDPGIRPAAWTRDNRDCPCRCNNTWKWKSRWRGTRPDCDHREVSPAPQRIALPSSHSDDNTANSLPPLKTSTQNSAAHSEARMPLQAVPRPQASMRSIATDLAWTAFKLSFGLTSLATVWATAVLKNGVLWAKDTDEEKRELAAAQQKYWSLDREPLPGYRHAFFTTSTGTRLHYVTNADAESGGAKNIGIFIHGMYSGDEASIHHPKLIIYWQAFPTLSSSGATFSNRPNSNAVIFSSRSIYPAMAALIACLTTGRTRCSRPWRNLYST
jgi:hypothetical protein